MNDQAFTPAQEFMAERAAQIEAGIGLPGSEGAMYRLIKRMDPNIVDDWIEDEIKRGTRPREIEDALGNFIANLMGTTCLAEGPGWGNVGTRLLNIAAHSLAAMATGVCKVEAIVETRGTGRQVRATTVGLASKGMPK